MIEVPLFALRDAYAVDVAAALIVHWIYRKYEIQPINYIPTTFLLAVVPALPTYLLRPHFTSLFKAAAYAYSLFHSSLITSIFLYRISPFHPLAKFPGPPLARLSKAWGMWLTASGKQHKHILKLHQKYGPYVRVGPNELSCLDANAIPHLMGANGLPKGPIWDARTVPGTVRSLIALRDLNEHQHRRKTWTNAFKTAAIKDYEPIIVKRSLLLAEVLEDMSRKDPGKAVDMSIWISYFVFDFMGDLSFGGGFELMSEGDKDGIWDLMKSGLKASAVLHHIPWIMDPLWRLPQAIASIAKFFDFAGRLVDERLHKSAPTKDLFQHLVFIPSSSPSPDNATPMTIPRSQMITDTILAMVAGSDTTGIVMSNILFYLLANPPVYTRLQKEIDDVFPPGEGDALDSTRLADCAVLNAVINEAMRLQPPVPSGSNRGTLRGGSGKQVGSHYVPPGTAIYIPTHTLHRSPSYFNPYPNTFWPDRWLPETQREPPYAVEEEDTITQSLDPSSSKLPPSFQFIHHTPAFIPFSYGPANCAGKNLALVEMRMVIALLVQRFEMRFADGYDVKEWEAGLEEWFLLVTGRLLVVFERRTS